jgi:hypothetical protein
MSSGHPAAIETHRFYEELNTPGQLAPSSGPTEAIQLQPTGRFFGLENAKAHGALEHSKRKLQKAHSVDSAARKLSLPRPKATPRMKLAGGQSNRAVTHSWISELRQEISDTPWTKALPSSPKRAAVSLRDRTASSSSQGSLHSVTTSPSRPSGGTWSKRREIWESRSGQELMDVQSFMSQGCAERINVFRQELDSMEMRNASIRKKIEQYKIHACAEYSALCNSAYNTPSSSAVVPVTVPIAGSSPSSSAVVPVAVPTAGSISSSNSSPATVAPTGGLSQSEDSGLLADLNMKSARDCSQIWSAISEDLPFNTNAISEDLPG